MDIRLSDEDLAFREEVRAFLREKFTGQVKADATSGKALTKDEIVAWNRIVHERGWAGYNWPVAYGGTGWTPARKYVFENELAAQGAPPVFSMGLDLVGPVIYSFGTEEQKARFLPPILASEVWWCQGYSEPGAGSDLASLQTRAVREGDHYLVTGTKTWTTMAQYADWMFCLVRTSSDGKRQEGITFLLIDMKTPGITVTPIITIEGGHEVNMVHLDEVRVPVENRIGEENKGWTYAKALLTHERTGLAGVARTKMGVRRLKEIARGEYVDGRPLIEEPGFLRRLSALEVDLLALEYTELRTLATVSAGDAPGPESSILKLKGTELQQGLNELTLEAVGYYAIPFVPQSFDPGWNEPPVGPDYAAEAAPTYLNNRKLSIFGGSNEIQKNIIAKAVLGL